VLPPVTKQRPSQLPQPPFHLPPLHRGDCTPIGVQLQPGEVKHRRRDHTHVEPPLRIALDSPPMPTLPELTFESTRTLNQSEFTGWVRKRPSSDCNRYELLNGRVVMTPPAGYPHGFIEGKLAGMLEPFIRERQLGVCLGSSQGFELPSGDTVAPDHSFVSTDRWQAMPPPREGEFLKIVPDLVVEILSPSTASHDRGEKRAIYERSGVREDWLVNSRARGRGVQAARWSLRCGASLRRRRAAAVRGIDRTRARCPVDSAPGQLTEPPRPSTAASSSLAILPCASARQARPSRRHRGHLFSALSARPRW
jgi:Uma2 family endonuclease